MGIELPRPPIQPDVDLRDYSFLPLDVARLRDSKIADAVSGDGFRAAVLLWCAAWHQVPAGSLPNDDVQLAKFAGYGRVLKEWKKIREEALYGFELCSDGRFYHPVICEKALEAWAGRKSASSRGKAGAAKRWGTANSKTIATPSKNNGPANGPAIANDSNGQGKGHGEGERKGKGLTKTAVAVSPVPPKPLSDVSEAFAIYGEFAEKNGWTICQQQTGGRAAKLKARLAACGGLEGWRAALERAAASDFCMGRVPPRDGHKLFKTHIDFLLQESSFAKLMEGNYDNRGPVKPRGQDSARAGLMDFLRSPEPGEEGQ